MESFLEYREGGHLEYREGGQGARRRGEGMLNRSTLLSLNRKNHTIFQVYV